MAFPIFIDADTGVSGDDSIAHDNALFLFASLSADPDRVAFSSPQTLTIDTAAPAQAVITGISNDTRASDADAVTQDRTSRFLGTAKPSALGDAVWPKLCHQIKTLQAGQRGPKRKARVANKGQTHAHNA